MTSDSLINSNTIAYSLGSGDNLGKSKNTKETIKKFKGRFSSPMVTPEKYREYKAASDKRQRYLKGMNGWMMRGMVEKGQNRNRNSIMPSQIITLDIDYATPEFVELLKAGKILPGVHLIAHSTRSHTPENPRLRIIIFLKGKVARDRYQAASRIVAQRADPNMEWVDKVSFRPAQMMYMPTVSSDMEKHYIYYEQAGKLLDHEDVIEQWELLNGSADDIGNLPKTTGEDDLREAAEQAEDPLEKKGPVGDFCRSYSVTELIEGKDGEPGILADTYEPVESSQGVITRMTYLGGTTSNGAVVYEDKWVWSHHGSDPGADKLLNAYDLVRIHKFGKEDKEVDKGTALKDLPSTKKMTEFLRGDPHYRVAQAESRYNVEDMLTDDDVDYEAPAKGQISDEEMAELDDLLGAPVEQAVGSQRLRKSHRRNLAEKPPKKWIAKQLSLTDDGIIRVNSHNLGTIVMNDPRLWRKIAFNEFSNQIVLTDDIKCKTTLIPEYQCKDMDNGDRWQDYFDDIIRVMIEGPADRGGYDISVPMERVRQAVGTAARVNRFHPIKEYILDCADNAPEGADIDTVLIDFFGAEDNEYNRQVSRMMMIASVARVFNPGCKFDNALILEGPQGIGKSTGIKRLYGAGYFGELDADLGNKKEVAEQMFGKWVLELPELSAMHKGEANHTKAFMSRQHDDVRLSYERHTAELPRQCVIWGTTNDTKYLRDTTGGRRYLPVLISGDPIDSIAIMNARDGLWRAAYEAFAAMDAKTPAGHDYPFYLTGEAAETAIQLQERARKTEQWETWLQRVEDWMDEEHVLQSFVAITDSDDPEKQLDELHMGVPLEATVCRVAFTMEDCLQVAFGQHGTVPSNAQADAAYNKVKEELVKLGWKHNPDNAVRIGGKRARWIIRPDATPEERSRGFRVCDPAQAPESGSTQVADDPEADSLI